MILKKLLIFGLIFNCIFVFACFGNTDNEKTDEKETAAETTLPPRPEKLFDLDEVYDEENNLAFDIYYPTKIVYDKSPLLVAFHGGGWVAGERSQIMYIFAPIIEELRENGYAVATVQYRYAQNAVFPAQIQDAANAVQYIQDNADKYYIDINSIGAMGYSAGAQLAMLASYVTPEGSLYEQKYSFDIKYCISFAGPSKMYGEELNDYSDGIIYLLKWLFDGEYEEKEEQYMAGSPYYYIDGNTKKTPLLLVHDEKDDVVPFSQSQAMHKKALEAKIPCELLVLQGVWHQIDFTSGYMNSPDEAARTILDFIYKY